MNKLRSNSGFGIIEILIAFGLVGILTAVMTTLFTNIQKQQRQANVITSINSLRETITKTIADGRAWENTIADATNRAASTDCLVTRDGTCAHAAPGADPDPRTNAFFDAAPFVPLPILRDAGGTGGGIVTTTAAATDGFTIAGVPCTSFVAPPGAGNDACPIQWSIRMQYTCPSGATCVDPSIRVIAMLYYNPNPNSGLSTTINESKYMVVLTRGARGENKSEKLEIAHQATGAGAGGGTCSPGAWATIPLNAPDSVELIDEGQGPGGNATFDGTGGVILAPGTYNCSATASCFSCQSLMMRIVNVTAGTSTASPGAVGPTGTMLNVAVSLPDIRANGPTTIRLEHYCLSHPDCIPAAACPTSYGMGMAVADYGVATKFSTLTCTRVF